MSDEKSGFCLHFARGSLNLRLEWDDAFRRNDIDQASGGSRQGPLTTYDDTCFKRFETRKAEKGCGESNEPLARSTSQSRIWCCLSLSPRLCIIISPYALQRTLQRGHAFSHQHRLKYFVNTNIFNFGIKYCSAYIAPRVQRGIVTSWYNTYLGSHDHTHTLCARSYSRNPVPILLGSL